MPKQRRRQRRSQAPDSLPNCYPERLKITGLDVNKDTANVISRKAEIGFNNFTQGIGPIALGTRLEVTRGT